MRRIASAGAIALVLMLAGCGGGDQAAVVTPTPTPTPTPLPTPDPTPGSFNVNRCLNQEVMPGVTVANLVVPDTVKVDFARPSAYPNGRQLNDPVIDLTLAYLFVDLTKHPARVLDALPLNPPANDVPFRTGFPYLAAAQGNPPLSPAGGTNFDFRDDPVTAYVRVDRMGMPAVATAVIGSSAKTAYNDDNPASDLTGKYVAEITATLTGLTNALADDFNKAGITICATK